MQGVIGLVISPDYTTMSYRWTAHMKTPLGVLLVLACMGLTSACRTSKEGYVAKGNKFFSAGKYTDAAINYDKAIQKDRNYGEAYYRLGLADIKLQDAHPAFDALYRAVQLMPTNIQAKEELGSLSLEYYSVDPNRPKSYYDLVTKISAELLQNNPNSFEGLREKAYLAMTDRKGDEAIALFQRALQVKPSDGDVTISLVQALIAAGQTAQAEKIALDFIARQKSYARMYDLMYEWYVKQGREADAENIIKLKVSNNPKQSRYLLELAVHYDRVHKPAEMQATLQRLLDDPKDFPQARLSIGDLYYQLKRYPEALHYYEDGARASSGNEKVMYQKRATTALLLEGKRDQASSEVRQILQEKPKDLQSRAVQGNILLHSGDRAKVNAAEHEFQELSKEVPNNASLLFKLGQAEQLQGNLKIARGRFQEALAKDAKYLPARYALAQIALQEQKPDETLRQADEILKVRPNDPAARLLRAQALARTGNTATARAELARLPDFAKNTPAQLELGNIALAEKKYPEAEQIFGKLRDTGSGQAIAGLAEAYTDEKKIDKALEVLTAGLKSTNSTLLLNQLGRTQALAGKYDDSIATFQKLVALTPNSAPERLELGDVFTLKGDPNGALTWYRQAAKLAPGDLDTNLEFAKALGRAGHVDEARTQFQMVLTGHADNPLVLNDYAYFLSQNGGDLDKALDLARHALQLVPTQPSFSDTLGYIYLKKGLKDSAAQIFANLVRKYPSYSTFHYHYGMALLDKGDTKSAKKELQGALAAHPSPQDEARIKSLLGKIG